MKKEIKFRAFLDDGIVQKSHGAQKLNVVQFASSLKLKKMRDGAPGMLLNKKKVKEQKQKKTIITTSLSITSKCCKVLKINFFESKQTSPAS